MDKAEESLHKMQGTLEEIIQMYGDKSTENRKKVLKYLDNKMRGYRKNEHYPEGRIERREGK